MYSIEINFLKDRVVTPAAGKVRKKPAPQGSRLPLLLGIGVGLLFPLLAVAGWGFLQWRTGQVQADIDEKNVELASLEAKQKEIDSLKTEIEISRSQVNGLAGIFGRIKSWSAILQDIRDRVPQNVKISSIKQIEIQPDSSAAPPPADPNAAPAATAPPKIALNIAGFADTYQNVNDFLLVLKESPLTEVKETRLVNAELTKFPGTVQQTGNSQVQVELPEVVQYQIETQLTALPDAELLRVLERKGALGLSTRLRAAEGVSATEGEGASKPIAEPTPTPTPEQ